MSEGHPTGILIVEDHFLARIALTTIINMQSDLTVVAEADTGEQAIELYRQHEPDVTLMDLRLPGMSGLDAAIAIRGDFPHARIIALTNYEGSEDVYRCLRAGVQSYLLKDTSGEELLQAIRTVRAGKRYITQAIASRLSERLSVSDLTHRELEVLELIVHGMSNKEIANALNIADKTVRIHVSNILSKMDVSDRTQAAITALQRGLVHLD